MADASTRRSPIRRQVEADHTHVLGAADAVLVLHLSDASAERDAARTLGLIDLSVLPKLGIKGPAADTWLGERSMPVPTNIYDIASCDDGSRLVRLGDDEFFIEQHPAGSRVGGLTSDLTSPVSGVYPVWREDATFVLTGASAGEVLAQTCGVDMGRVDRDRLIMTRVAGVSCSILPQMLGELSCYRLWLDPSFAASMWETLTEIVVDLGGRAVGAGCVYPELSAD